MGIYVWENLGAQPWEAFQGVSITNYAAAPIPTDLGDILEKLCTIQGLVLISGSKLATILRCLLDLKKDTLDNREFLYSAITDMRRELLRGDRSMIAGENRENDNANR